MNLSQLNAEVEHEVNQRQVEIIGSAFDSLKRRHQKRAQYSDCACTYCTALRKYVEAKLRARRIKFRFDFDDAEAWIKTDRWSSGYVSHRLSALDETMRQIGFWQETKNQAKGAIL